MYDVDDATLVAACVRACVRACVDYEKSSIPNLDIGGILHGATVKGDVHIIAY